MTFRDRAAHILGDAPAARLALAVAAIAGVLPVSGWIGRGTAVSWWPLAARDWALWGGLCVLVALVAARGRPHGPGDRDAPVGPTEALTPAVVTGLLAAIGTLLPLIVSWLCFRGAPHSVDEIAQRWQATILLHGAAWVPADTRPDLYSVLNVVDMGGRWYSQFPPGGPFLLAVGVALGMPMLPNALATGATAAMLYRWARRAGEGTARLAAALFVLSPFVLFMGASQQNHPPAMALTMLTLLLATRWTERHAARGVDLVHGAGIGLATAALATIRPLEAIVAMLVACVVVLPRLLRDRAWARLAHLAAGALAGALVPTVLLLSFNARTTGHALRFGYDVLWGANHGLGFHESPYGEMHTPARGLALAARTLTRLNLYLLEWPLPPLLLLGALAMWRGGLLRHDRIATLLLVATLAAYALYWHDGFFLGPRFAFIAVPATIYLVARGVTAIVHPVPGQPADPRRRRFAAALLVAAVALSLIGPGTTFGAVTRGAEYRGGLRALKVHPRAEARRAGVSDAVVLVPSSWGERLVARMWAAGVSRPAAERMLRRADACVMHEILDLAARATPAVTGAALESALAQAIPPDGRVAPRPDLTGDAVLRFSSLRPLSAACESEVRYDAADAVPYAPFLIGNDLDGADRIGGEVIFIRDMRDDPRALLRRFEGRRLYRYHIGAPGAAPSFEPIEARR